VPARPGQLVNHCLSRKGAILLARQHAKTVVTQGTEPDVGLRKSLAKRGLLRCPVEPRQPKDFIQLDLKQHLLTQR